MLTRDFILLLIECVEFVVVHSGVQCHGSELHTAYRFCGGILIARGVATLGRWIISCWFGCSHDVSFALRVNICFLCFGVI